MYSPGTIKALGLISKGANAEEAFNTATKIDNLASQSRLSFYNNESLSKFYSSTLPSAPSPSAVTGTADVNKVTPINASTNQYTSIEDMLTNGNYGKSTQPSSGTSSERPILPKDFLSTEAPQKKASYYDSLFPDLVPVENLFETNRISKDLVPNSKGIKTADHLKQTAIDHTAKILSQSPLEGIGKIKIQTPEQEAEEKRLNKERYESIASTTKSFLDAEDPETLREKKKYLDQQIESELQELNQLVSASQINKQALGVGAAMNLAYEGNLVSDGALNSRRGELIKAKNAIDETYKKRQLNFETKKAIAVLEQELANSTDADAYLKTLDRFKNVAGGIANLSTDAVTLIKKINEDKYMDRPLTEQDIALGGERVINEQALNRFAEKTSLTVGEAIAEDRYDNTRNHIVEAHAKFGIDATKEIQKKSINLIKRQEQLVKESEAPGLTEEKAKALEKEFKSISGQIELNNKIINKFQEIHSYDAIKENKEIKNFAGSFLEEQEALAYESRKRFSDKTGLFSASLIDITSAAKGFLSGSVKQGTGILRFAFDQFGWDDATTAMRRFENYVTPRELVDFATVDAAGQYKTQRSIFFSDDEGKTSFNPGALLITGAEVAPLVLATVYGGSALSGLGGRALAASKSTLLAKNLMSAQRASQFTRALATTKNYGQAYRAALSQSGNGLVRAMGTSVPFNASMGALVYPQEFNRTYEDLYRKGIPDARIKSHAIAAISTGIELMTEMIFPEYKLLDDFAEKGVLNKNKWTGSFQQYRTLYGDVFGKVFSGKTLDYLAANSLEKLSKGVAVGRFMASRGAAEGIEEVTAEVLNFLADNQLGLAAMRGEPPSELSGLDLVNAFAGGLVGPPIGVGTQIKQYEQNRHFGQLFDIMMNGQYYKSKISQELKAGKISHEDAAVVLSKIQELEAVEAEYGVRNLRNFQSIKSITSIQDLMDDPNLQFDYFKSIIEKRKVEEALVKLESGTYTEDQKKELLDKAKEAEDKIGDYKKRSDFYSQMSDGDKKKVIDDNIDRKVNVTRFANNSTIDSLNEELEEVTAQAVLDKRPEYLLESLRSYRDRVDALSKERKKAEINAKADGNYNPITDALENTNPDTSITDIQSQEELADLMAQAILSPNKGHELALLMNGGFDRQLEQLEKDNEAIVEAYLESLNTNPQTDTSTVTRPDGSVEVQSGESVSPSTATTLENLTEEQQKELSELLAEINSAYDDLVNRKKEIQSIVQTALSAALPSEIRDIQDVEARDTAIENWIRSTYETVFAKAEALRDLLENDGAAGQDILFDFLRFNEYISSNLDAVEKKTNEYLEKYKNRREGATPTETRDTVATEEGIDVPELVPSDVTPEFEAAIEELSDLPETITVSVTSEATNDIQVEERNNPERARVLQQLLGMVAASTSLASAKAKMFAVMQAAGVSSKDMKDTLELMDRVANSEAVFEENYTHMFELLLVQAGDIQNLRFPVTEAETIEANPVSDTEAQKADVEKRRQEISEEGLQELNSGNQTDAEIESQPTGSFKQLWGYLRGKFGGSIDNLIEFVANPSDLLLDLNKVLSGVKISKIGKAYSTFINELEKQTNLLNSKLEERVNKGIRENYPQASIDKLTKEKDEKIAENNKILQKAKEINAKYDAELAALEQKEQAAPESNPLANVDSTSRALREKADRNEGVINSSLIPQDVFEELNTGTIGLQEIVSKAYHKAKKDGTNPELVQAVETLLKTKTDDVSNIEAKKADIERRRKEELDKEENQPFDFYPRVDLSEVDTETKNKFYENERKNKEQSEKRDKINAKYDAEYVDAVKKGTMTKEQAMKALEEVGRKDSSAYAELAALEQPAPSSTNQAEIVLAPIEVQNTAEQNIEETKQNTEKVIEQTPTNEPTPEQVDTIEDQQRTHKTTTLKMFVGENNPDSSFLEIQEKIIETVNKEGVRANTAVVDFFTLIEDVLGSQVLTEMEAIFNEVQRGVTEERKAELRNKFIALIPGTFMKPSAKAYIFDQQIVGNISRSNVNVLDQRNLNATQEEIFQLNKKRTIPEVTTNRGVKHKNVEVAIKDGKILLVDKEEYTDAEGKIQTKKTWIPFDTIQNPETVFVYPAIGAQPIQFNDLNVLVFTVLDSKGKVQKFTNDGVASDQGNKSLLFYLPSPKNNPNPTEQQKEFNNMRLSLVEGNRINQNAPLVRPVIAEKERRETADGVVKPLEYTYEFSTDPFITPEKSLTPAEVFENKVVAETISQDDRTQESSEKALTKLIEDSKSIPDPSKEGYIINGKKYERQSGFVARVLGKVKVETEDSVLNMELGAAVGNLLDIVGRDVLGGAKVKTLKEYIKEAEGMGKSLRGGKGYKLNISPEQFEAVVAELKAIQAELSSKGWKIFTEGLIIHREFTAEEKAKTGFEGVAGAMDIVAIDPDGGVHIIDFKNKKFKSEDHFKSTMYKGGVNYPSNISKWNTQQTTYSVLSRDFGLPIESINILAFASQYTLDNDTVTIDSLTLGSKEVSVLDKHKSPISESIIKLRYDSEIIRHIEAKTQAPQPAEGQRKKDIKQESIDKLKEHLPEFTTSENINANLVLSSLGINLNDIVNDLDVSDINPDNQNIPPC